MTARPPYYDPDKYDLFEIVKIHPTEQMAEKLSCSARDLYRIRQGLKPLSLSLLREMAREFPELDVAATVWRLSALRRERDKFAPGANTDDLAPLLELADDDEETGRKRLDQALALLA